jgi:hypothetical protein
VAQAAAIDDTRIDSYVCCTSTTIDSQPRADIRNAPMFEHDDDNFILSGSLNNLSGCIQACVSLLEQKQPRLPG